MRFVVWDVVRPEEVDSTFRLHPLLPRFRTSRELRVDDLERLKAAAAQGSHVWVRIDWVSLLVMEVSGLPAREGHRVTDIREMVAGPYIPLPALKGYAALAARLLAKPFRRSPPPPDWRTGEEACFAPPGDEPMPDGRCRSLVSLAETLIRNGHPVRSILRMVPADLTDEEIREALDGRENKGSDGEPAEG